MTAASAASRTGLGRIELVEHGVPVEVALSARQSSALRESELVTITPGFGPGRWFVGPARFVGVARVGGVEVWVRPKLQIRRLLFLLGYAYDLSAWRQGHVEVDEDTDLLPAVATAFARQADRAVAQGLIQGYRTIEEHAPVLRGRIRTDEQLRRRFGLPIPLEVRYDDYTIDIAENRILRTTAERLLRVPRVPRRTRHDLLRLIRLLADVRPIGRGLAVPAWQPSRLNARYHGAMRLGELVLRGGSIEHASGSVPVDGFMLNMPVLFEQFLTVALREALVPRGGRLDAQSHHFLDEEGRIRLKPDVVWYPRAEGSPSAVADAKYKAEKPTGYPNADAYQMLAYCLRLGLPVGHLVYATGETEPGRHRIIGTPVTLVRHALDLDVTPEDLFGQVHDIAEAMAGRATPL